MKRRKVLSLVVVFALVVSVLLAGCGTGTGSSSTTSAPTQTSAGDATTAASTQGSSQPDTSKEVHLVGYLPGDKQQDDVAFMDQLNGMLKKDVNATLEFKYIGWGDFSQKYPLVLASGEEFDFIYIANWADFSGQAQKGAFSDITDLLPKYCPDILNIADKDAWKSVTQKGKTYGIPTDGSQAFNDMGAIYREDLREKYNVPEIKKVEDFEAYMQAIKQNEKGMKPAVMDSVNNNYFLDFSMYEKTGLTIASMQGTSGLIGYAGLAYRQDDPAAKLISITQTPEFKTSATLMNKWQKMGFWDTSDMVNKNYATDPAQSPFGQGKAAIWRGNTGNFSLAIDYVAKSHPDWKIGFYYPQSPSGNVDKIDSLQNGVAISPTSKNPERALMAIDKMLTVQDYKMLLGFGVKDKDYVLDGDGIPQLPSGVASDKAPFGFYSNAFSWFVYDGSTMPTKKNDAYNTKMDLKDISKAPALLGFTLDTTNIKGETAAVNDVLKQYEVPLAWGFAKKSIDEEIGTINDKLKAAGIDKVQTEIQNQADQFLKDNAK